MAELAQLRGRALAERQRLQSVAFALCLHLQATLAAGGALMLLGVLLHLAESHGHEHTHEALAHEHAHSHDPCHADGHHLHSHPDMPTGPHSHWHQHAPQHHVHAHVPDAHHQHRH
jgi:hypothetical protein